MWLLYGSEIAACIGENKYKKKWEVMLDILKRLNNGTTYQQIINRLKTQGIEIINTEEKVKTVLNSMGLEQDAEKLLTSEVSNSIELQQQINEFESQLEEKEKQIKSQKNSLKLKTVTSASELSKIKQEVDLLQTEKKRLVKEYNHINHEDSEEAHQKICEIHALIQNIDTEIQQQSKQKQGLEKVVQTVQEDLEKQEILWNDFKQTKKNLISKKQTDFGKVKENHLISFNQLGVITNNNSQFYKKKLGETPIEWGVGGRIDGFRDGVLIEIKNRKTKLYDPLPVYDMIQVQCYMQLLDVPNATVIQCLTTEDNQCQTKEIELTRDDTFWKNNILSELTIFIQMLYSLATDVLLQDNFFQTLDSKKSYIITSLYNKIKKSLTSSSSTLIKKNPPKIIKRKNTSTSNDDELVHTNTQEVGSKSNKKQKAETKTDKNNSSPIPKNSILHFINTNPSLVTKSSPSTTPPVSPPTIIHIDPKHLCFFGDINEPLREPVDWNKQISDYIPADWKEFLHEEISKEYFTQIQTLVDEEYKKFIIFPPREKIFNALHQCPVKKTRVIILGLDPYINPSEAHGMSFSVPKGVKFPRSLKNIFLEIQSDLGFTPPVCGDLSYWGQQGVLLLNSILTVQSGKTGSHEKFKWKTFTNYIIKQLSLHSDHLVFLLWGSVAQEKESLIDTKKHTILKTSHPSPYSFHKGFNGCKHFSLTNQDLISKGLPPIDWNLNNQPLVNE